MVRHKDFQRNYKAKSIASHIYPCKILVNFRPINLDNITCICVFVYWFVCTYMFIYTKFVLVAIIIHNGMKCWHYTNVLSIKSSEYPSINDVPFDLCTCVSFVCQEFPDMAAAHDDLFHFPLPLYLQFELISYMKLRRCQWHYIL